MQSIQKNEILALFQKYEVQGFINISDSESKSLEYSPLHDELSFDTTCEVQTTVTIIKNHKKSVYGIDGYSMELIENAIQTMLSMIDFGQYDTDIVLPEISDEVYKDFSQPELEKVTFQDMEKEFHVFKNFGFDERISIESFSMGIHTSTHTFLNSFGAYKIQKDNSTFCYMDIFGEIDGQRDNHYEYISSQNFVHITTDMIEKLQETLLQKLLPSQKSLPSGKYTITLERDVVIDFLEIIIGNLGAESIRESMSLFSDCKLEQKLIDQKITIINNPDLAGYTGNMLFDKEGVTAQKRVLFENGIWKSKFYDYKNALKEGIEFLGNSTVSNIELNGQTTSDFLQNSQFLFTHLMAFHTVDETTGKFSLNGQGYRIENGQKKDFVKNISLSGDVLTLFNSIESIGDDFKPYGSYKVPSITFSGQKII